MHARAHGTGKREKERKRGERQRERRRERTRARESWEGEKGRESEKGWEGEKERETERGVFRGPALASWHLTICQNSPHSPFIARRSGGSLNLCASADDGRVPHPLLPRPHFPRRHRQRPPPPKDPTADGRSSSETAESRADRITSARRALSDLDSCDAFALLARLVKVTGAT